MKSVELFAGAGGLAMGLSRAGFKHDLVVERDRDACATIRANQECGLKPVVDWTLFEGDVRHLDYSGFKNVDLLAGGPPCQPFSIGGKHRGFGDGRDMFPEMIRAVRELKPRAVIIENVKGLLRKSFADYFEYVLLQLNFPEFTRKKDEEWSAHLSRLRRYRDRSKHDGLFYRAVHSLVNAADYGVPQKRERVIIVAFRDGADFVFPEPTHSRDALLWEQWVTGEYWERHAIARKNRPKLPERLKPTVEKLEELLFRPDKLPWVTVRDAISDLPDPQKAHRRGILNHAFNPGARAYPGHTGSPLDAPAKTLKAGDHGVPGGENMLALPDGALRYFTVRESARLQTFPDEFGFFGSWTESMRQLGNAVPVRLAESIGNFVMKRIKEPSAN